MGGYEYKLIKNRLAAVKTPGIEIDHRRHERRRRLPTLVEYRPSA